MPRNRAIYIGVLIVAASALLYIGGQVIRAIEWFLPWAAGAGIALILVGLFVEAHKSRKPKPTAPDAATAPPKMPFEEKQ
jgi:membrane-bound ClpP family serine protease